MALALFDLGRTLVRGDPAMMFARHLRARGRFPDASWQGLEAAIRIYHGGREPDRAVDLANAAFASAFAGLAPAAVEAWAEERVRDGAAQDYYDYTRALLETVRGRGYRTVAVTGVADPLASVIGRHLGLDETYATTLETDAGGRLTGRTRSEGGGPWKRRRVEGLLRAEGAALAQALAFGDSEADLALLEAVGRPVVVNARGAFAEAVAGRGWPMFGEEDDVAGAIVGLLRQPAWNEPRS